jgi:hypothetical protein
MLTVFIFFAIVSLLLLHYSFKNSEYIITGTWQIPCGICIGMAIMYLFVN